MGTHPVNLALRFLLELAALLALGLWGWAVGQGMLRYILAPIIPVMAAVLWGTFAVPDDPSRSGKAPVPVPGILRLVLELSFFGLATWAIADLGAAGWSWALGITVAAHYLASYDRVQWLLGE